MVPKNLGSIFLSRVKENPEKTACASQKNQGLTFGQLYYEAQYVSNGLFLQGVRKGDRVAIFGGSSQERAVCDLAILGAGAMNVPLHPLSIQKRIIDILKKTRCSAILIENEILLEKFLNAQTSFPGDFWPGNIFLIHHSKLVPADQRGISSIATLAALSELGREQESKCIGLFEKNLKNADAQDPFTILFTSNDENHQDGVVLTHDNVLSSIEDARRTIGRYFKTNERTLCTVDPSQVLSKVYEFYSFAFGWTRLFSQSGTPLQSNELKTYSPTLLFTTSHFLERALYDSEKTATQAHFESSPWSHLLKKLLENPLADQIMGSKMRFCFSGGGPLSPETIERYAQSGIAILEGYGLAESCGPVSMNLPEAFRAGSAGKPLPEVSVKTTPDGEIWIKSRKVFKGYYLNPELSLERLQEGWLRTGDLGYLDADGYLHILGHKNELISVMSAEGEKKVSPAKIESTLQSHPYFEHFVVFGDQQGGLCALITLRPEPILYYAEKEQILYSRFEDLVRHPRILGLAQLGVDELNLKLRDFERIQRFIVLPGQFRVETGELTSTRSLRRPFIQTKFRAYLDSLTSSPPSP